MRNRWWLKALAVAVALALPVPGLALEAEDAAVEAFGNAGEIEALGDVEAIPEEVGANALLAEAAGEDGGEMVSGSTETGDAAEEPAPADAGSEVQPEADAPEAAVEPDLVLGVGEQWTLEGGAEYASDAPEVVAADAQTGVITAVAVGRARVTAVAADGAALGWVVEVKKAPKKLTLSASKRTLGVGETARLTVKLPSGTASARVTYKSNKRGIVTVDAAGNLRAKKAGSAVITVRAFNGVKAKCAVTVVKAPSKVRLSAAKLVLCAGEAAKLKARLPAGSASVIAWTSDNEAVAKVDGKGRVTGVGPGTATVAATTFNGKRAACEVQVLDGSVPTGIDLGAKRVTLGLKEKYQLVPALGDGEATLFTYDTGNGNVAKVSKKGVVTGKKKGSATITVKTHNGLTAKLKVTVVGAPGRVSLSRERLTMRVGETTGLSAWVPTGTASALTWTSSAPEVAAVDDQGGITALKAGEAQIVVSTYNGQTKACAVVVSEDGPSVDEETDEDAIVEDGEDDESPGVSVKTMVARLRASGALGSKREAVAGVVELLLNNGFEPAFAAGVGANVLAEGTYGMFESSRYVTYPKQRPRYFCYLDGGEYYTRVDGEYALTAVYLSEEEMAEYDGDAEPRLRFDVENFYLDNYSRKNVTEVSLSGLEALMERLAEGGWEGKFGLGIVQWTGSRTKTLVACYRKHAGSADRITAAQVVAAENEMILRDFEGSYSSVRSAWKQANKADPDSAKAARSAGALVCTRYEIPADKESKAITRGDKAAEIYRIMMGEQ